MIDWYRDETPWVTYYILTCLYGLFVRGPHLWKENSPAYSLKLIVGLDKAKQQIDGCKGRFSGRRGLGFREEIVLSQELFSEIRNLGKIYKSPQHSWHVMQ